MLQPRCTNCLTARNTIHSPGQFAPCVSEVNFVGRDYDPAPGQWYENAEEEETFQVLSVDEDSELIEIQYLDGDIEEIDLETWAEMDLEKVEEPEGWSGSEADEEEEEEEDDDEDDDDWDDDDEDDEDDDDLDDDEDEH
jgi:hypothetical protein